MRIISGKARGTKLYTLEGDLTRPTLDRVKESLFNIIQEKVLGSVFLDLFAGSGAIGLEAASRGAKKVILCEKENKANVIINKNIEKTHLGETVELHHTTYEKLLDNLKEKVDIVYIDPPYKTNYAYNATKILLDKKCLKEQALIIIETDEEERILNEIKELKVEIIDKRKYGRVHLIFIQEIR